jgi:glycosyltransferase involved in cell wall biosynthesis
MMANQVLLSVLVPTYQQESYIGQCLESIINQIVDFPVEILVGDDCSSDATARVAASFAVVDARIQVMSWPKNEGGLKNIDKLLQKAQGNYIAILEGDDFWLDMNHLSKSLDYLESHQRCNFTAANYLHLEGENISRKQKLATKTIQTLKFWHLALGNFIQMGTIVYRRQLYCRIRDDFIALPLGDYPLVLSLLQGGEGAYLHHDAMAYRVHSGGIWSGQAKRIQADKTIKTIDVLLEVLQLKPLQKRLLRSYRARLALSGRPKKVAYLDFASMSLLLLYVGMYNYRKCRLSSRTPLIESKVSKK